MSTTSTTSTVRNYRDNFDFKQLTTDILVPKFFPNEDISTRMSGLLGLTTEQLSLISEDAFHATSTLLKEFFINKATLPESIYNYAALFQLSDVMGSAASCRFLIVFKESNIQEVFEEANMFATSQTQDRIYISKDTKVYVEDIPFVFDYDIEITRKKTKLSSTDYVYGAKYIISDYKNSISNITNPYIKIRRAEGGFFALDVTMHQCLRNETIESIIDNSAINYPVIDVKFDGILAGFDAFYKAPGDTEYTQMITKVYNSLPEKDPFCYYRIIDENELRLSFSLADSYFQPEFNSEIKIVTYTTKGNGGNFSTYTGSNVSIELDTEVYTYNETFIMNPVVVSASSGGTDKLDIEELRHMVSIQYSTSTVLSTDHDLELYFENYEEKNANLIKFIKRRDDLVSRLFTGFMVCKNEDYVYPTNTLDISTNFTYWDNPDGGHTYTLEPGHLFTYNGNNNMVSPMYKRGYSERKPYFNFQGQTVYEWIYQDYFIWLHSVNPDINPNFDKNDPDWETNWIESKNENETFKYYFDNILNTCADCGYHTHRTYEDENGTSLCPVCRSANIKTGSTAMDSMMMTVYDVEEIESRIKPDMFVFANPFLTTVTKYPGLVNYYLTIINQTSVLDFIYANDETSLQFIANRATISRPLSKEKEYTVTLEVMPSLQWNPELLVPGITTEAYVPKRSQLSKNNLRIMMVIMDGGTESCYLEMVPVSYEDEDKIKFQCTFRTNDHVTLGDQMQINDYSNEELGYTPVVDENVGTEYTFDESEALKIWMNERQYIESASVMSISDEDDGPIFPDENENINEETTENTGEETPDTSGIHGNFTYLTNGSTKLIPMTNVEIRFVVLVKDYEAETESDYVTDNYPTSDLFFNLHNYQWTNVYSTFSDTMDLIKPLNMVRSSMYFRDDRLENVNYGDIYLYSSPFIKYSLLQHYDSNGNLTKNESGVTNFEMFTYMIDQYYSQYQNLESTLASIICQASYIDLKFFNCYGRSNNYIIGDNDEIIDRVNMSICFHIYLEDGTDELNARDELRTYIKETVEELNEYGHNDLHISNLMRSIENDFAYVDHIRFIGINGEISESGKYTTTDTMGYSTEYQSIKNITKDLTDLSKEERFSYVPEMLCINKDQIALVFYEAD